MIERKHAENKLESERVFLSAVFDNIQEAIVICDAEGKLVRFNEAARRLHGLPELPIPSDQWAEHYDLYHKDGITPLPVEDIPLFRALQGERVQKTEIVIASKHSRPHALVCSGQALTDKTGRIIGAVVAMHDITDRKRFEDALQESKTRYEEVMSMISDIVWRYEVDDQGQFIGSYISPVADRLLGLPPGTIGNSFDKYFSYVHPEDLPGIQESLLHGLAAAAKESALEYRLCRPDKTICWVRSRGSAHLQSDGHTTAFGTTTDITDQKRTEAALRDSEKKYQSLFDNAQVALFRTGVSDGKLIEINRRYAQMAGYENVQDCMAEFNSSKAWTDPAGRDELVKILREKGHVNDYETEIIRRDGTPIWILFSATVFPEPGFIEGSIVEITDRKQADQEREKLQAQLIQAQKMESVGRLAGGVAHDFNNMLGIILGNTEIVLEDMDADSPFVENMQEIRKAAERSADFTRQLLAFARKQTIAPQVLDLNKAIDGMLNMLRRLMGEDIDLAWRPKIDLWLIKLDPSQVHQVLANLCVNARDSIKSVGKVTIETDNVSFNDDYCREHEGFRPGDYVMTAVSDNGSGMDRKTLKMIFEPFFTTKDVGQGTGLGLSTVYGIVKQNDGFITVYSEPDEGTTFKIYFSRHIEKVTQPKSRQIKEADTGGDETILLVEDEKGILQMTTMMLERLGYTVLPASTPAEAIYIGESYAGKIDMLMTDVVMPEMSGWDMAKKLMQSYTDLKCLFMSGYTANVIAHHGVLDEGIQFINKPFSKQELASKVREVLAEAKGIFQG
ncbi:MAG: PAS domain S-box protein [Desulfobacterales bacterium]|nr:PAS domain S-box protein [Desulfobacterales bacterium]